MALALELPKVAIGKCIENELVDIKYFKYIVPSRDLCPAQGGSCRHIEHIKLC